MTKLLDKGEVAQLLHVSARTIDRLRTDGQLQCILIRGRVRFDPSDVSSFLQAHKGIRRE